MTVANRKWALWMTTVLMLSLNDSAIAQSPTVQSSEEIVRSLQAPVKTRSIFGAGTARNLQAMVDLTINFDFDSANLRDNSREQLKNLSHALKDARLQGRRFRVEGHTDAVGTLAYNDELSERRARSVVEYLGAEGVPVDRLEAVGKGFREPLDPNQPQAALNRRVRILALP